MTASKQYEADRAALSDLLNESHTIINFRSLLPSFSSSTYDSARLPPNFSTERQQKALITAINSTSPSSNLPPLLSTFFGALRPIYTATALSQLINTWPLSLPSDPALSAVTIFLLHVILKSGDPCWTLKLIATHLPNSSLPNDATPEIKDYCRCHYRSDPPPPAGESRKVYWATLNSANYFELFEIVPKSLTPVIAFELGRVRPSVTGRSMRITTIDDLLFGDLEPLEPSDARRWGDSSSSDETRPIPLDLFFQRYTIPDSFYLSFYQQLISDDLLLLQAILDPQTFRVTDSMDLAEALLDVFSYAGKVNLLLTVLCAIDFAQEVPTSSLIVRRNSQLSNMFKVFISRYAGEYIETVIAKVRAYVLQCGDCHDKVRKQQKMVITVLKTIMRSGAEIPPQIRHFASVMRVMASYHFNQVQAVVTSISGYFSLRLFNRIMIENVGGPRRSRDLLVSFAQLLQVPLNFALYRENHAALAGLHHHLLKYMFPELIKFMLSVADVDKLPSYTPPKKDVLQKSLGVIVSAVMKNREAVIRKYKQNTENKQAQNPVQCAFGAFLMSFFEPQSNH